jgi:uncharacterized protein YoxC
MVDSHTGKHRDNNQRIGVPAVENLLEHLRSQLKNLRGAQEDLEMQDPLAGSSGLNTAREGSSADGHQGRRTYLKWLKKKDIKLYEKITGKKYDASQSDKERIESQVESWERAKQFLYDLDLVSDRNLRKMTVEVFEGYRRTLAVVISGARSRVLDSNLSLQDRYTAERDLQDAVDLAKKTVSVLSERHKWHRKLDDLQGKVEKAAKEYKEYHQMPDGVEEVLAAYDKAWREALSNAATWLDNTKDIDPCRRGINIKALNEKQAKLSEELERRVSDAKWYGYFDQWKRKLDYLAQQFEKYPQVRIKNEDRYDYAPYFHDIGNDCRTLLSQAHKTIEALREVKPEARNQTLYEFEEKDIPTFIEGFTRAWKQTVNIIERGVTLYQTWSEHISNLEIDDQKKDENHEEFQKRLDKISSDLAQASTTTKLEERARLYSSLVEGIGSLLELEIQLKDTPAYKQFEGNERLNACEQYMQLHETTFLKNINNIENLLGLKENHSQQNHDIVNQENTQDESNQINRPKERNSRQDVIASITKLKNTNQALCNIVSDQIELLRAMSRDIYDENTYSDRDLFMERFMQRDSWISHVWRMLESLEKVLRPAVEVPSQDHQTTTTLSSEAMNSRYDTTRDELMTVINHINDDIAGRRNFMQEVLGAIKMDTESIGALREKYITYIKDTIPDVTRQITWKEGI